MGIKHRVDSCFRKFLTHNKLFLCEQVRNSEMPDVSNPKPLAVIKKDDTS